jgi:DNA polymerase-3 subunit beta
MISFESGGRRLTGRLIGGEFIRYESRFPAGFGCRADLPAASITEAVRRVSLVADRTSPVRLTFSQGKAVIEAQTEGRARAVETVTASFHGDQPSISFNPHYLLDGLAAAAGAAGDAGQHAASPHSTSTGEGGGEGHAQPHGVWVRLEFTSPAKPALITPAPADGAGDPEGEDGPDAVPAAAAGPLETGTARDGAPAPVFRYLVVPLRVPASG